MEHATMPSQYLEYRDGETVLEAYVALPAGSGKHPAVLVSHAWAGRSAFECDKADKLADLGYVGIAIDNYGKGVFGSSMEENSALMTPFVQDRAMLRRRLQAGIAAAAALPQVDAARMAAIGFCFGGLCALDMARSGADLRGVVSFHGLFRQPENLPNETIRAKILALHGHDDPMVPPEAVLALEQELSAAGADWQIHAYGRTMHAFMNPDANAPQNGMQYNPIAAARAWASMKNFLAEVLA
jgi:dienelactone hydrolase